jgi:hypothetical protein
MSEQIALVSASSAEATSSKHTPSASEYCVHMIRTP